MVASSPSLSLDERLDDYEVTAVPASGLRLVWVRPLSAVVAAGADAGAGAVGAVEPTGSIALLDAYRVSRVPASSALVSGRRAG